MQALEVRNKADFNMERTTMCHLLLFVTFTGIALSEVVKMTYVSPDGLTCIKCFPGTYLIEHCKENNVTSKCVLCPNGTYSSTANQALWCAPCRTYCPSKFTIPVKPCTPRSNMECDCPHGTHNIYPDFPEEHAICKSDEPCPVGYGVVKSNPSKGIIVCEECEARKTFSPDVSPVKRCEVCTVCDEGMNLTECTTTRDRECRQRNHSLIYQKQHKEGYDVRIIILVVVLVIAAVVCMGILTYYLIYKRFNNPNEKPPLEAIFTTPASSECLQNVVTPRHGVQQNPASVGKYSEKNAAAEMNYEQSDKHSEPHPDKDSMMSNQPSDVVTKDTSSSAHVPLPCTFREDNEVEREFSDISRILNCDWKEVMRHILKESGVYDVDEVVRTVDIDYKLEKEQEKAYQCLLKWKQLVPRCNRREMIIAALSHCGMDTAIAAFQKLFPIVYFERSGEETV